MSALCQKQTSGVLAYCTGNTAGFLPIICGRRKRPIHGRPIQRWWPQHYRLSVLGRTQDFNPLILRSYSPNLEHRDVIQFGIPPYGLCKCDTNEGIARHSSTPLIIEGLARTRL
jgi:hypothetical protein